MDWTFLGGINRESELYYRRQFHLWKAEVGDYEPAPFDEWLSIIKEHTMQKAIAMFNRKSWSNRWAFAIEILRFLKWLEKNPYLNHPLITGDELISRFGPFEFLKDIRLE